ncbi:MAG TPA: helix-turn-helix transcriptional regulator [Pseudonocardiaceae bacterium]|nr:helix-turn-helix transcriptional regulator [Pseudonocardiaceae bacterium]
MDVGDDARTIGRRLRLIRHSRREGLRVIAGLAGMSKSKLSLIERGERALDSRSDIVALANALQISPSELVRLPVLAPGNGQDRQRHRGGPTYADGAHTATPVPG